MKINKDIETPKIGSKENCHDNPHWHDIYERLEIGESVAFNCFITGWRFVDRMRRLNTIRNDNKKFSFRRLGQGGRVWRIKP